MPKNLDIKKVLVLGSGPIVIGQAAEFDYAGTQACRSLKEEGIEVVLLNSNPATIMTDKDIADKVYIEPLTTEVVEQLILKERPESVLPTIGGQAGLNLAMELDDKGFLKEHKVRLIGTTALTIKKAEDRELFKETMEKIGEPVAPSDIVEHVEDGLKVAEKIGYPVVLRPAYTLGGSGGGIAENPGQCREILENGLRLSRGGQVLVERCIAGWKEIEYEVMRDGAGKFTQDFSSPALLRILIQFNSLSYTGLSPSSVCFPKTVLLTNLHRHFSPTTPQLPQQLRFGLFPVRSPLLGKSFLFSLPPLT